jgi:plasmid stability protein
MATLTIRNLPEDVAARLKAVAARRNSSMEQEVRSLLEQRYGPRSAALARIRNRWSGLPPVEEAELEAWRHQGRP